MVLQVEVSLILPIPAHSRTLFCGLPFLYKEQLCCVFKGTILSCILFVLNTFERPVELACTLKKFYEPSILPLCNLLNQ